MTALRLFLKLIAVLALALALAIYIGPAALENAQNRVAGDKGEAPSPDAMALHQSLEIADLHADTLLWYRSMLERSDRGQVNVPRMLDGNMAIQMLTVVRKSPSVQNYGSSSANAGDNITLLALIQRWPLSTRNSLFWRAIHQSDRLLRSLQRAIRPPLSPPQKNSNRC